MKRSMLISCTQAAQCLLAPPYCFYCLIILSEREHLCSSCCARIEQPVSYTLQITKGQHIVVHSLGFYEDPVRTLIRTKHHAQQHGAYVIGELLARTITTHLLENALLVPIPLHWTRYASRGFNQAEVIASRVAAYHHVPVVPLLVRTKRTPFQARSPVKQRHANVQDAFMWNPLYDRDVYQQSTYILVDDLMTTGATLVAAARCLLDGHSRKIVAIVAARVR